LAILPCTSPCAARHSGGAKNTPFWIFLAPPRLLSTALKTPITSRRFPANFRGHGAFARF